MKKFKILVAIIMIAVIGCFALTGCSDRSSIRDKEYSEEIKEQIANAIGYPELSHFFEYSQLKEIYELRDDPNLICFWYTKNEMSGKWIYEGKCIGYGIPYSASITSPDTIARYNSNGAVVSQAEPNGIFTNGLTTSATWIIAISDDGNIAPQYVEPSIRVSQTKIDASRCEEWSLPDDY